MASSAAPSVGVSYVMPVLNEAGYLEAAIASIVSQDHPGEFEIILAVGPSTDGTAAIVKRLAAADPRIRIVENPGMDIPIGLNLAIRAGRYPTVVRVDAVEQVSRNLRGNQVVHLKGSPEKLEVSRTFTHLFKQM